MNQKYIVLDEPKYDKYLDEPAVWKISRWTRCMKTLDQPNSILNVLDEPEVQTKSRWARCMKTLDEPVVLRSRRTRSMKKSRWL